MRSGSLLLVALSLLAGTQAQIYRLIGGRGDPEIARFRQAYNNPRIYCDEKMCPAQEAVCVNENRCNCKDGMEGNGMLGCFTKNAYHICAAIDGRKSFSFQGNRFDPFPSPCRILLSNYKLFKPQKRRPDMTCTVSVWATHSRVRGNFYVTGYDVHFRVDEPGKKFSVSFRFLGWISEKQVYQFETRMSLEKGKWFHPDQRKIRHPYISVINKGFQRHEFEFPECGFKSFFRPANYHQGNKQTNLPGLIFGVEQDAGEITWLGESNTVCMSPPREGVPTLASIAQERGVSLATMETILVFSEKRMRLNYMPKECADMGNTIQRCPDGTLPDAFEHCETLLSSKNFVSCFSRNVEEGSVTAITALFERCMKAICNRDNAACKAVQDEVKTECPRKLSGLTILNADACNM